MNDDFNSPVLIANLFDAVKFINSVNNNLNTISKVTLNKLKSSFKIFVNDILGLYEKNNSHSNENKSSQILNILIVIMEKNLSKVFENNYKNDR